MTTRPINLKSLMKYSNCTSTKVMTEAESITETGGGCHQEQ